MSKKRIGVYPGTFDPITKGHKDIIERSLTLFDELIVAVAGFETKGPLFSTQERIDMIKAELNGCKNVKVVSFDGLFVNFVDTQKATTVVRGLRVMSDFEYEFRMALTNRKLAPHIETVFLMTDEKHAAVSSRFVKEIARLGGKLSPFVSSNVAKKLKAKYKEIG